MSIQSHNQIKEKAVQWADGSTAEPGRLYKNGDKYRIHNGRQHYELGELQVFEMYEDKASFPGVGAAGMLYYTRITGEVYIYSSNTYKKVGTTDTGSVQETALSTYIPDTEQNNYFEYGITRTSHIGTLMNTSLGKTGTIVIAMDAYGGHSVTFDSSYNFIDSPVVIDSTANAVNMFKYTQQGMNAIIMEELTSYVPGAYFAMKFTTDGLAQFAASDAFEWTTNGRTWTSEVASTWTAPAGDVVVRSNTAMASFLLTGGHAGLTGDVILEGIGSTDCSGMFVNSGITSVNLRKFRMNAIAVGNVDSMFNGCASLKCITNLDTTGPTGGADIFNNCTSLKNPTAGVITDLEAPGGTNWNNTLACP